MIQEASQNRNEPYIVCLDEMNLARVEYYFSDFLSLIESRRKEDGEIITDSFVQDLDVTYKSLPDNLYIVGTVNMDETTFQFSRKVLDRANTIELSDIDLLYDFEEEILEEVMPLCMHNEALRSEFLLLKDCKVHKELTTRSTGVLLS